MTNCKWKGLRAFPHEQSMTGAKSDISLPPDRAVEWERIQRCRSKRDGANSRQRLNAKAPNST